MFRLQNLFPTCLPAIAIVFFNFGYSAALAEDAVNPDTPVSSEAPADSGDPNTSVSSDSTAPSPGSAGLDSASSPSSDGSAVQGAYSPAAAGAEVGSQVTVKTTVSHEQEKKDRLFVDATSIAVAIVLLSIAFFLFMSLPKQSKKTGNDSVQ
ncbi:MAG: hypothetical protein K2Y39_21225 [Candidatus Obscuribacterales bacterium]|nr:hypothetical protein [Candidatus Obscuribacterales bacterium]